MTLRQKVESARAKPRWEQGKEDLETFLTRELGALQEKYSAQPDKPRVMSEELLKEIQDDVSDVFARAGMDPTSIAMDIGFDKEDGTLHVAFQPADFKQQRDAQERRASSGSIVDAFGAFMDACKAVQRAANLIKPLVESLGDSARKERVVQLLETQVDVNDRAAVAMGELLLGEVERAQIQGSTRGGPADAETS